MVCTIYEVVYHMPKSKEQEVSSNSALSLPSNVNFINFYTVFNHYFNWNRMIIRVLLHCITVRVKSFVICKEFDA